MAAVNNINSSSNYTVSLKYQSRSSTPVSSLVNKDFSRPKLNYRIALPADPVSLRTTEIFNQATPSAQEPAQKCVSGKAEGNDQALLGPLVLDGAEIVKELSGNVRETYSLYHKVYGTQNPKELAALGLTTGFSLVAGGLSVRTGIKEIETANRISDTVGKTLGGIKVTKGAAVAAGGAIYIPVRALSIASLLTSSKIVSTLVGVLGSIGSGLFQGAMVLGTIALGIRLDEQRQFRAELNAILEDPALTKEARSAKALEHLKKLAAVSPEEKEEVRKEVAALPESQSLTPEQLTEKVEEKAQLLLEKKGAYLKRLTSEDCLNQIRQKEPAEACTVVEAVQKESTNKTILTSVGMALLIIGLAVALAAYIFTGPIGIIITTAVGIAVSGAELVVDGYELIKEFKSTDPGRYDKIWIFLTSVLAVVAVSLVFFLSSGLAPIIIASVFGAFWLATNSVCYYRLYHFANKS